MSVAVIGSGVVGLSTALVLAHRGHAVRVYSDPDYAHLASESACAIWLPFLMSDQTEGAETDEINEARRWAQSSWHHFAHVAELQSRTGEDAGVRPVDLVEAFREKVEPPYYASIVRDFHAGAFTDGPDEFSYSWQLKTFVIEMPKYLPWLHRRCEELGVRFRNRHLSAEQLRSLPEPVVFNCAGLGSRELFADEELVPIKGQLLLLDPMDLTTAIGADEFCIIPRSDSLILGSLFFPADESHVEDVEGTNVLLSKANEWARSRIGAELNLPQERSRGDVRSVVVGLRPYRKSGPVVEKKRSNGTGPESIYHNYGHGGSGVTFAWGCGTAIAEEYERNCANALFRVNPDRGGNVCDVSIEIGHVEVDQHLISRNFDDLESAMKKSSELAKPIIDELNSQHRSYNLVALFDDKTVSLDSASRRALIEYLESAPTWFGVDYVCFESQLVNCIGSLVQIVDEQTEEDLLYWKGRHHEKMACSHDIVTWYSLRLGLIANSGLLGEIIRPVSIGAKRGSRPFSANRLVSVLRSTSEKWEVEADSILARSFGPEVASLCERIYFD